MLDTTFFLESYFTNAPIQPSRAEKLTLAVLAASLKKQTNKPIKQFKSLIRLFQPETVFGWHRALVKRKWTHARKNEVGRPPTAEEVKKLVIQLALENDDWGYGKISGELEKLGIELSETAVGDILRAKGIEPAPVRAGSIGWKTLMNHYREQLLACDFFPYRDNLAQNLDRFFLHRHRHPPGLSGWYHRPSHPPLGHPTSPQSGLDDPGTGR